LAIVKPLCPCRKSRQTTTRVVRVSYKNLKESADDLKRRILCPGLRKGSTASYCG
jgi:hypothetical protein